MERTSIRFRVAPVRNGWLVIRDAWDREHSCWDEDGSWVEREPSEVLDRLRGEFQRVEVQEPS